MNFRFPFFSKSSSASSDEAGLPGSLPESEEAVSAGIGRALLASLLRERESEAKWRNFRRVALSGSGLVLFAVYVAFYATSVGYRLVPNSQLVGVVHVDGEISSSSKTASAQAIIDALKVAFDKPNVQGIVLAINSGGGQPGESERVTQYLEQRRAETHKPVIAVVQNTGASAAYMIAMHADKVYAGRYSMVGSIGAILATFDYHKVLERFDVERKVFASGSLKGMLDQWSEATPEADAKAHDLVNRLGQRFAKEVQDERGDKLKKGVNLWTGEVWTGEQALDLGLIDKIGTIDSAVSDNFGKLASYDFGPIPKSGGIPFLSESFIGSLLAEVLGQSIGDTLQH